MSSPNETKEKRVNRLHELWALVRWVIGSWVRPCGSVAIWEQQAGKEEMAWEHQSGTLPASASGGEQSPNEQTKTQGASV